MAESRPINISPHQNNIAPLQDREMEYIRRVYDADSSIRKYNAVASPREDAQMMRPSRDDPYKKAEPCECVTEIYELLWRWSHRSPDKNNFAANFGFAIPDSVVILKGRIYAWYFISKKDGALLRKSDSSLTVDAVKRVFCRERPGDFPYCATWMPCASQFPEAKCGRTNAEFMNATQCSAFLNAIGGISGVLQAFVEPHGVFNFLVRTVQFCGQTSLCVRTNRSLLPKGKTFTKGLLFDRAATFEGWAGLSSTASHYRCHKHPHMEELILVAGEQLNRRIEEERVRQMLFLDMKEHIALHFKVTADHMLYFIYASVVNEKDVILQTREKLLMGDACVQEPLHLAGLLPGGTDRKAPPFAIPQFSKREPAWKQYKDAFYSEGGDAENDYAMEVPLPKPAPSSRIPQAKTGSTNAGTFGSAGITSEAIVKAPHSARDPRRRPLPIPSSATTEPTLPKMGYARPTVPLPPYQIERLPHSLQEAGRYEYTPPFIVGKDSIKRPLVTANSGSSGSV
jgi:hypothetical protein